MPGWLAPPNPGCGRDGVGSGVVVRWGVRVDDRARTPGPRQHHLGMADMTAEYHSKPRGHFVFAADTWERVKKTLPTGGTDHIAGQIGRLDGAPVYIDVCPWGCRDDSE